MLTCLHASAPLRPAAPRCATPDPSQRAPALVGKRKQFSIPYLSCQVQSLQEIEPHPSIPNGLIRHPASAKCQVTLIVSPCDGKVLLLDFTTRPKAYS